MPLQARDRRVRLGAAAVAVALVLVAAGALLGGWRPFAAEPSVLTFGPGGDLREFTLFEGQCASGALGPGGSFGAEADTPCGNPHDVEVVASRTPLQEGRPVAYPGEAELARYGRAYCAIVTDSALITDTVGDVDRDDLDTVAVIPSATAWDSGVNATGGVTGERQVSCVVTRSDGEKLTDRASVI